MYSPTPYFDITIEDAVSMLHAINLISTLDGVIPIRISGENISIATQSKKIKNKKLLINTNITFLRENIPDYELYEDEEVSDDENEIGVSRKRIFDKNKALVIKIDAASLLEKTKGFKVKDTLRLYTKSNNMTTLFYSINSQGESEIKILKEVSNDSPSYKIPNNILPIITINKTKYSNFCNDLKRLKKGYSVKVEIYVSGMKFLYSNYGIKESVLPFGIIDHLLFSMELDPLALLQVHNKIDKISPLNAPVKLYAWKETESCFMIRTQVGSTGTLDMVCISSE